MPSLVIFSSLHRNTKGTSTGYRQLTPALTNPRNQPALEQLVKGYEDAKAAGNDARKFAFSNAINALRSTTEHVTDLHIARGIKYIGDGPMGQFVIDANCGCPASL
jgi:hypothetical protein